MRRQIARKHLSLMGLVNIARADKPVVRSEGTARPRSSRNETRSGTAGTMLSECEGTPAMREISSLNIGVSTEHRNSSLRPSSRWWDHSETLIDSPGAQTLSPASEMERSTVAKKVSARWLAQSAEASGGSGPKNSPHERHRLLEDIQVDIIDNAHQTKPHWHVRGNWHALSP